jgi:pimeloyl-ACP methyl ester carboxylesterase
VATFELLHGAWHAPSCWDAAAERLEALGHRALTPDMPLHDPAAGYDERVRPALEALDGADGPVVVVAHSQSSAFGPLVAAAWPVALLVYLCPRMGSFETPGAPPAFREGIPFPETGPDGTSAWDPDVATRAIYPRLAPDAARRLAGELRPMAMPPGAYPLNYHPAVPTELILATEDELFEPAFERYVARELLDVEPIEIGTGHFPMAEDPAGLADLLAGLAGRRL